MTTPMQKVVLRDERSKGDSRYFSAEIRPSGNLVFYGQDLGDEVEKFFSCREYEWSLTVEAKELPRLAAALGGIDDILTAIAEKFSNGKANGVDPFLKENDIPYEFWSRVGD